MEWAEYCKIRGPIGLDRWDFYVKRLIFANGAPNWGEKVPKIDDLRMPWDPEPSAATTKPDGDGKARHDAIFVPTVRRVRNPGGFGTNAE